MNEEREREVTSGVAGDTLQNAGKSAPVAQEEDSCYRAFFEASNDGMLLATADGII